jgi:hypothetical protein
MNITVSAKRAITRLAIKRDGRAVRVRQRRLSPRTLRITLTPAEAAGISLAATIGHRQYTTTIG